MSPNIDRKPLDADESMGGPWCQCERDDCASQLPFEAWRDHEFDGVQFVVRPEHVDGAKLLAKRPGWVLIEDTRPDNHRP